MEAFLKQSMDDLNWWPGNRPSETFSVDGEHVWKSTSHGLQVWDPGSLPYPNWPQSNNQPGTSSEVVPKQTNVSTAQPSPHPNTSKASRLKRNESTLSESDREKKRRTDQAYRAREKKKKQDMQQNLGMLTEENEYLKKENESLKKNDSLMRQTLRNQEEEIHRLRNGLFQLKSESEKQNALVQTLSEFLADPLRLEIEKLRDENALLRMNASISSDIALLVDEVAKLKTENKVLKVQNDALCGKIISDNGKKRE
ncbi:hypothetical protein DITRI_Ditri06bG0009400 [Diplodiscus trichospermus]